jgi:hypothetical protein
LAVDKDDDKKDDFVKIDTASSKAREAEKQKEKTAQGPPVPPRPENQAPPTIPARPDARSK